MLYFIPAWYKQNMWCENEQQWYMRRLKSEFDETIKQALQDSCARILAKFQTFPTQAGHVPLKVLVML